MADSGRVLRADARRNRGRLLEAADAVFRERGLDVGVGEIAQRAGVGRGTLFRNFTCKQDLIAAIVVERMRDAVQAGRALLEGDAGSDAVFGFIADIAGRQQVDRALFEAVADEFLANREIRAAHAEVIEVLDGLLDAAKRDGFVRPEVGALDVLMMLKGACAASAAFGETKPDILERHLDLVRAAISTPAHPQQLRGTAPTLADLERTLGARPVD
ncbi:MAG: TetR/AcrR family transcriptional regulator [Solirubrobacteraceae bacterium]